MKRLHDLRRSAHAFWLILVLALRVDPRNAFISTLLTTFSSLLAPALAIGAKLIVDGVEKHAGGQATFGALLIAAFLGLLIGASLPGFVMQLTLNDKTTHRLDQRMLELTTSLPGLEHHERSDYADKLAVLRNQRSLLSQPAGPIFQTIALLVSAVFTTILLVRVHPFLLLVTLAGVPIVFGGSWAERVRQRWVDRTAEDTRIANHLFQLATTAAPAKEVRIFGLGPELLRRHGAILDRLNRERLGVWLRTTGISAGGAIIASAGYFVANLFIVIRAVQGHNSAGDVVLTMTLSSQAFFTLIGLFGLVVHMTRIVKAAERYLWFEEYAAEQLLAFAARESIPAPSRIAIGIEMRGVRFRYPGAEVDAIADVDLSIPAGSTVAIVGENGAGKTTLVKLLCRFYEPSDGEILVDGDRLQHIDLAAWRSLISAGYQDFVRFELVAAHAVGVGNLPDLDDRSAVRVALGLARSEELEEDLPQGLETQLGRSFKDGADLSMGQWQKVALGRAMMRPEPLLLVLDEPTASLDAQTEHALFERYATAARRTAASRGGITILVSHRFSTVRMADLILVVDKGRLAEYGSHADLMRRGGLYAELYEVQAKSYR